MIESIVNAIQLLTTGTCSFIALYSAVRSKERAWIMLGLFSGIFFLGDLYWMLFLIFYQDTPRFYSVSDLSWYASYLFLMLLILYLGEEFHGLSWLFGRGEGSLRDRLRQLPTVLWCVPVFTICMCVFFVQRGDYLSNIVAAVLMTGLIWLALDGFLSLRGRSREQSLQRMLYGVTILFCLTEYALWTSSCFWTGETVANVYYWFDLLLSFTFLLFLPALRKAVGR